MLCWWLKDLITNLLSEVSGHFILCQNCQQGKNTAQISLHILDILFSVFEVDNKISEVFSEHSCFFLFTLK